jgi:hypothetical protein
VAAGSEPSHRVAFMLYRCLHVASACTNVKAELTPRPSSRSPFSPPLYRLHRARERKPSAAAAVATAAEHHQPIPRSHRRTVNSSTSWTTPHNRLTSGRARRACASTTATIAAATTLATVIVSISYTYRCAQSWCARRCTQARRSRHRRRAIAGRSRSPVRCP